MRKDEFLHALQGGLRGLPQDDIRKTTEYYSEMIDERIEDGIAEEDAVRDMGSVDDVVASVVESVSLPKLLREKVKPQRRLRAWEIVLLVLGFPLWGSLLIAAAAVVLSVYIALWAIVVSFFAVMLSLAGSAISLFVVMVPHFFAGASTAGLASLGSGMLCAGLAILTFYLSTASAKGAALLGKTVCKAIKRHSIGKERAL